MWRMIGRQAPRCLEHLPGRLSQRRMQELCHTHVRSRVACLQDVHSLMQLFRSLRTLRLTNMEFIADISTIVRCCERLGSLTIIQLKRTASRSIFLSR